MKIECSYKKDVCLENRVLCVHKPGFNAHICLQSATVQHIFHETVIKEEKAENVRSTLEKFTWMTSCLFSFEESKIKKSWSLATMSNIQLKNKYLETLSKPSYNKLSVRFTSYIYRSKYIVSKLSIYLTHYIAFSLELNIQLIC